MKRSGRFGYWDNDMKSKPQQVDTTSKPKRNISAPKYLADYN